MDDINQAAGQPGQRGQEVGGGGVQKLRPPTNGAEPELTEYAWEEVIDEAYVEGFRSRVRELWDENQRLKASRSRLIGLAAGVVIAETVFMSARLLGWIPI